jgi:UrcA family protein
MPKHLLMAAAMLASTAAAAEDVHIFVFSPTASELAEQGALRERIAKAIDQGCGVYSATPFDQWADVAKCRRNTKASAEHQIGALFRNHTDRFAAATGDTRAR